MKKNIAYMVIACLFLSGCALQHDMDLLNDRLSVLEMQNMDIQRRNAELEKLIQARIENYGKTLEEKDQEIKDRSAGLYATVEKLREDMKMLRGRIEETEYLAKQKTGASDNFLRNAEQRLSKIENYLNLDLGRRPAVRPAPGGQEPAAAQAQPAAPAPRPGGDAAETVLSDSELYAMGKQAFDEGDDESAREYFQRLLKKYPRSRHADNAQFWIGEVYYRQKWYEKAILEYQTVIEKYPNGNKVRSALLKQAFAFADLGDKANARLILEDLVKKYPNANEARIAQQKLQTLR